jgi:hypothetical protein
MKTDGIIKAQIHEFLTSPPEEGDYFQCRSSNIKFHTLDMAHAENITGRFQYTLASYIAYREGTISFM